MINFLDLNEYFHLLEVISTEEMMILDNNSKYLGIPTLSLMENAGNSIVQALVENNIALKDRQVCIFAGLGNNGGDAFVAARQLTFHQAKIIVFLLGDPIKIRSEIAKLNWDVLQQMNYSVKCISIKDSSDLLKWEDEISLSDVIIDGILGTGIRGKLREPIKSAIKIINKLSKFVCSVDVPSGLNPDTGEISDESVKANITVTFHKAKKGLLSQPNVGKLIIKNIGIPPEAEFIVGKGDLLSIKKRRPQKSHKGDFGKVLVIGGNDTFSGAPALVSLAALRTGTDLVITMVPSIIASSVRSFSPNLIVKDFKGSHFNESGLELATRYLDWSTSIAIGPGLGKEEKTKENVIKLLTLISKKGIPTVIDADALKAIKDDLDILKGGNFLLTPHMGEYNIISKQNLSPKDEFIEIIKNVFDFSKKNGVTTLLKGTYDIITDGQRIKINKTGTPALTVGGTGDVLTGISASLIGMKLDIMKSASIAAFLNGMAGELVVKDMNGEHLVASDLLNYIPKAFSI
ncbi:MAG: NAD(P)H-hydrate dehydratase [Promethearchaeota archaeon]